MTRGELLAAQVAANNSTPLVAGAVRDAIAHGAHEAHGRPVFARGFDAYACTGDRLCADYEGFRIEARIERDQDHGINDDDCHSEAGLEGCTAEQRAAAFEARAAWMRDEWFYCGIVLSVSRKGVMLDDYAAALWGIECNYPGSANAYLTEVACELLPEAIEAGRVTLSKLLE